MIRYRFVSYLHRQVGYESIHSLYNIGSFLFSWGCIMNRPQGGSHITIDFVTKGHSSTMCTWEWYLTIYWRVLVSPSCPSIQIVHNISLRFSTNSEANASELVENLNEMFPRFFMYIDICIIFKYLQPHNNVLPVKKSWKQYAIKREIKMRELWSSRLLTLLLC